MSDNDWNKKEVKKEVKKIDKRDDIHVVTANQLITADGLSGLSLNARKLFLLAIAQCKQTDTEFYEYETTPTELAEIWGINRSHIYEEAESVGRELMKIVIKIQTGERSYKLRHLFEKCDYTEDKTIYFQLHKDMSDQLLGLNKNFTQPLVFDFMRMRSKYSMEIWHLMQREMQSFKPMTGEPIEFYLSVAEIRKVTGTEDKLKNVAQLKRIVLDTAIKEIKKNLFIGISYSNVKRGRTIIGFVFTAENLLGGRIDPEKISYRTRLKARRAELIRRRAYNIITPQEEFELGYLEKELQQISMEDYDEQGHLIDDYDDSRDDNGTKMKKMPKTKAEYEKIVERSVQTDIPKEVLDSGYIHEKEPNTPSASDEEWNEVVRLNEDFVNNPEKYLTKEEMDEDSAREKEERQMKLMFKAMIEQAGGMDKFMETMKKMESNA